MYLTIALLLWSSAALPSGPQGSSSEFFELLRSPQPGTVWLIPAGGGGGIVLPTIQAAVDSAFDGDSVVLSTGWFRGSGNRDVLVRNKGITIRSEKLVSKPIIACERKGRAFLFDGPGVSVSRLSGITIWRGAADLGGAILVDHEADLMLERCLFMDCEASNSGGALNLGSTLTVTIVDSTFLGNSASSGGAISGVATIDRSIFRGNSARFQGGAMSLIGANVFNSIIAENHAETGGGIDTIFLGSIENCTFVANSATVAGGGLYSTLETGWVKSSIFWANQAPNGSQVAKSSAASTPLEFYYCDVNGSTVGVASCFSCLHQDPLFVNSAEADYRLSPMSPCRDVGDPGMTPRPNEGDFENQARTNGRVDIGADEHWDGLALSLISPGRAGELNELEMTGALPGELLFLFAGVVSGGANLSFGNCPNLVIGIADPDLVAIVPADSNGIGQWSQEVPISSAGSTIYLQAIGFDPGTPVLGCMISNLVTFVYPL